MQVSYFKFYNYLEYNVRLRASYDSSDWENGNDPGQLYCKVVKKNDTLEVRLDMKARRNCSYWLKIDFKNAQGKYTEGLKFKIDHAFGSTAERAKVEEIGFSESQVRPCGGVVINNVSWKRETYECRGTQNVYLYPLPWRGQSQVRFFVLSDTHIMGDEETRGNDMYPYTNAVKVRESMMADPEFLEREYIFITGDLVDHPVNNRENLFAEIWPCSASLRYFPLVCEGYGNHDMYYSERQNCDMAGFVRNRNNTRYANFYAVKNNSTFRTNKVPGNGNASNLHYTWSQRLYLGPDIDQKALSARVHFYMLNLVPTCGCANGREQNSSCALDFLEECLSTKAPDEPIFIFHHYGFYCSENLLMWAPATYKESDPERFVKENEEKMAEYIKVIGGHHVAGIFYGHMHYTANGNYQKTEQYTLGNIRSFCVGGSINADADKIAVDGYVDVTARVNAAPDGNTELKVSVIRRDLGPHKYDLKDSKVPTSRDSAPVGCGGDQKTENFLEYTVKQAIPDADK